MNWIKKLFHTHDVVWESRQPIGRVTIDFTVASDIDLQDGTRYLLKGYCLTCGKKLKRIQEIADIFDMPQPYDVVKDK